MNAEYAIRIARKHVGNGAAMESSARLCLQDAIELQAAIDTAHKACKERVQAMQELRENPQVALMIEKNKGYMMAMEDVTEMLYGHKIF